MVGHYAKKTVEMENYRRVIEEPKLGSDSSRKGILRIQEQREVFIRQNVEGILETP